MTVRSKWQALPTEAINPSSLGIDKLCTDPHTLDRTIGTGDIDENRKLIAHAQGNVIGHLPCQRVHAVTSGRTGRTNSENPVWSMRSSGRR